jgi:hypothetical protein
MFRFSSTTLETIMKKKTAVKKAVKPVITPDKPADTRPVADRMQEAKRELNEATSSFNQEGIRLAMEKLQLLDDQAYTHHPDPVLAGIQAGVEKCWKAIQELQPKAVHYDRVRPGTYGSSFQDVTAEYKANTETMTPAGYGSNLDATPEYTASPKIILEVGKWYKCGDNKLLGPAKREGLGWDLSGNMYNDNGKYMGVYYKPEYDVVCEIPNQIQKPKYRQFKSAAEFKIWRGQWFKTIGREDYMRAEHYDDYGIFVGGTRILYREALLAYQFDGGATFGIREE